MVRSGARRNLPLYVLAGITIALFGIPLGFGGVGVLAGLLIALIGVVFAYYMVTGSFLLVGAMLPVVGPDPGDPAGAVGQTGNAWLYPIQRAC
jgi:uncharacterized membrane protein